MSTFSWRTQPLSAAVTGRRLPRDPRRRTVRTRVVVIVAVLAVVAALLYFLLREAPPEPPIPGEPTPVEPTVEAEPAVLWAAGDIARCDRDGEPEEGAVLTAELIEQDDGIVAALGDLAYPDGTEEDFEECYDQTWGAFRDRTRPALSNHDDNTDEGDPYFEYFESLDMPEPEGWYSYELGEWHVIVLNSNCGNVGGCDEGDPQGEWLREELDQVDTDNILAYWHNPLFSAGLVEHLIEVFDAVEVPVLAGGEQRVVPVGEDVVGIDLVELLAPPLPLGVALVAAADVAAVGVQHDDVPLAQLVGVPALRLRHVERLEVLEIGIALIGVVVVVAQRRTGAVAKRPPGLV